MPPTNPPTLPLSCPGCRELSGTAPTPEANSAGGVPVSWAFVDCSPFINGPIYMTVEPGRRWGGWVVAGRGWVVVDCSPLIIEPARLRGRGGLV